ncbi:hypothetical protein [Novosphingobium sp.]|uniref:hypothetical protein n=1 Tax=Novosphingobium sp. TaxID=1874826 RepID=UPI002FDD37CD
MPDALDALRSLAANYRRWARQSEAEGQDARAKAQLSSANNIEAVVEELDAARKRLRPVSTDLGDLSDLPEELIKQLNVTKVDELEQQLRDIVAAADGTELGLDQILIELWRRHKVVGERRFVMNKLYRMAQKGTINSVDGKKGSYCLPRATTGGWGKSGGGWGNSAAGFGDDEDDDIPF